MHTTDRPPLEIVVALCRALDEANVRYCHFKSNDALDRSASGENDLDLLVDRRDGARFSTALLALGFKPAQLPPSARLPGINDWYGSDPASQRLVHAHVHHQLLIGDDMTKNVHLPIERAYFDGAFHDGVFKVPPRSLEFIVFVIRMILKHAPLDAIATGQGRLSSAEQRELAFLESVVDPHEVDRYLAEQMPFLEPALFQRCRRAISGDRLRLGASGAALELQRALTTHSTRAPAADTVVKVTRRVRLLFVRKVLRIRSRKRLVAGGVLIAVIGGDGAGKSSVVSALVQDLGRDLDVRRFHLGKPPRSPLTHLLRTPMRAGRMIGLFPSTRVASDATIGRPCPGAAWLLWHVLNGRDRRRTYAAARRFATGGGIAVCDRYPLPQLSLMDGSRVAHLADVDRMGTVARRLADYERRCYESILAPDVALVMHLDPQIAVGRRPEQDEDFVRERNCEVHSADWSAAPFVVIDASRPRDDVLAAVRASVWEAL